MLLPEKTSTTTQGPLTGVKIIEMVGLGPCPFAGMLLSDMGAEVIRIDRRSKQPTVAADAAPSDGATTQNPFSLLNTRFDILARGRRSLGLNLKQPEANDVLLKMIQRADILIEGFRPGTMEKMGLSPEICWQHNPKLIFGRMTGWGQNGPLALAAGHDLNYIALSGMLQAMGQKNAVPMPPLNLLGDFGAGGMLLAFGVLCAYIEAQRSGKGQVVDAAMVDGTSLLGAMIYGFAAHGQWKNERESNLLDGGAPFYGCYECLDGKFIALGSIEPQFYAKFLEKTGLIDDPFFQATQQTQMNRAQWPSVKERLQVVFKSKTRAQWCDLLEGSDACAAPVLDLQEAMQHPHNVARANFVEVAGVMQPAPAPRFSRTPPHIQSSPASSGAHSEQILLDWGFDAQTISQLQTKEII